MANKFQFTKEGVDFIKSFCAWFTQDGEYYYIPHVFKKVEGSDNQFYLLKPHKAPGEIMKDIQDNIEEYKIPKTPKEILLENNLEGKFN